MRWDAIVFDLDGTLLDTLQDIADSTNRALAKFNFPTHSVDSYRHRVGDGVEMLIRRAIPADRADDEAVRAVGEAYRAEYAVGWNRATRVYDGIEPMLDALGRRGVKIAVLSNKPDDFTHQCVERYLSRWHFDAVMGAIAARPRKPDPAGAIEIASRLRIDPPRWAYLGDSHTDMETAHAAGMTAIGAAWGFRGREELERANAALVLDRPEDLMAQWR